MLSKSINFSVFKRLFLSKHILTILMPPPCGGTEGADRNADSVWPSGWHFVSVDAGKHTEEGEVALDVFVQLLEGNGDAQLLVEVGLVSGELHMGHKVGRLLLVQQPGIAKALDIAALGHEITLLHMLGSQTMLNRPWEQLNVIQIKFSTFHIVYCLVNRSSSFTRIVLPPLPTIHIWLVGGLHKPLLMLLLFYGCKITHLNRYSQISIMRFYVLSLRVIFEPSPSLSSSFCLPIVLLLSCYRPAIPTSSRLAKSEQAPLCSRLIAALSCPLLPYTISWVCEMPSVWDCGIHRKPLILHPDFNIKFKPTKLWQRFM